MGSVETMVCMQGWNPDKEQVRHFTSFLEVEELGLARLARDFQNLAFFPNKQCFDSYFFDCVPVFFSFFSFPLLPRRALDTKYLGAQPGWRGEGAIKR